jgi:hypothetical protein
MTDALVGAGLGFVILSGLVAWAFARWFRIQNEMDRRQEEERVRRILRRNGR